MDDKIRILVVEDEITSTIFLKRLLTKNEYEVKTAYNGDEALKELELGKFDIILTDWMMPKLDGIELTRRIRENVSPSPYILMLTALVSEGARTHALHSGADDYLAKPINVTELLERIEVGVNKITNKVDKNSPTNIKIIKQEKLPDFIGVGIATSTGGPPTLVELIKNLDSNSKAAYFIVQHGPPWMIETFASRLSNETKMPVHLGSNDLKVEAGSIYLSPGDSHMLVNSDMTITLDDGPKENFVRPAADPMFRSIANSFNERSIGIVLTGLGRDGVNGSSVIKKAGGMVLVQDPSTAIAPSMPQSVIDEGIVDYTLNVETISNRITTIVNSIV